MICQRNVMGFVRTAFAMMLLFAMSTAWAAVPRHPLSLEETQRLVAAIAARCDLHCPLPMTVNDAVVARLNHYITDPGRAKDMHAALQRMDQVRPMIDSYLKTYQLPKELVAVPLVESGYQNLSQADWDRRLAGKPVVGAGLWMFIRATARNFGLAVSPKMDERLDPESSTDAAMRLLASDKERFGDWWLALSAYNAGTTAVKEAIHAGGTRDAWKLNEQGLLNDYIVFITAAVILIDNPQLVL
jgi:membrane-bound lytic murein transglycosylase D